MSYLCLNVRIVAAWQFNDNHMRLEVGDDQITLFYQLHFFSSEASVITWPRYQISLVSYLGIWSVSNSCRHRCPWPRQCYCNKQETTMESILTWQVCFTELDETQSWHVHFKEYRSYSNCFEYIPAYSSSFILGAKFVITMRSNLIHLDRYFFSRVRIRRTAQTTHSLFIFVCSLNVCLDSDPSAAEVVYTATTRHR